MSDSETEMLKVLMDGPDLKFSDSESTSSLESCSEEEESVPRRKRQKIMNYVEETVEKYDDREFKGHFRLSRKTTTDLIDLFEQSGFNPKYLSGRPNVSAKKTVLLSLWYLGNRNSFREVSDRFGVAIGTAHACLTRFLNFLMHIKDEHIVWPNHQERLEISRIFTRNGFPGAIGAIDGSHIEIPKPDQDQDSYINRKGYHSLLLQGVVDHNKKFIDVFCGEPGSLHDARLLRRSALYATICNNPGFIGDFYLLGDSAYPNLDWIVTPYPDTGFLSENQKIFNQRLSSKRVVVENAFGLLKGRFRRLKGLENLNLYLCSQLILGCCILHNICLNEKINSSDDIEDHDGNQPPSTSFSSTLGVQQRCTRQQEIFRRMFDS